MAIFAFCVTNIRICSQRNRAFNSQSEDINTNLWLKLFLKNVENSCNFFELSLQKIRQWQKLWIYIVFDKTANIFLTTRYALQTLFSCLPSDPKMSAIAIEMGRNRGVFGSNLQIKRNFGNWLNEKSKKFSYFPKKPPPTTRAFKYSNFQTLNFSMYGHKMCLMNQQQIQNFQLFRDSGKIHQMPKKLGNCPIISWLVKKQQIARIPNKIRRLWPIEDKNFKITKMYL